MSLYTAIELRSAISTWLDGQLGLYLFPTGDTTTAIAVLPDSERGYDYPPPEVTVSGIECVIVQPRIDSKLLIDGIRKRYGWDIYLKQWDNNGSLVTATETLIDSLGDNRYEFTSPVYMPINESAGILATVRLQIYSIEVRS